MKGEQLTLMEPPLYFLYNSQSTILTIVKFIVKKMCLYDNSISRFYS